MSVSNHPQCPHEQGETPPPPFQPPPRGYMRAQSPLLMAPAPSALMEGGGGQRCSRRASKTHGD